MRLVVLAGLLFVAMVGITASIGATVPEAVGEHYDARHKASQSLSRLR